MKDFRSYDVFREAAAARESKLKLKKKRKSGACCGSSLKKLRGLMVDRQLQRRKRVAGYNLYSVKGRVKVTLRESLRWFKRKCAGLAYGRW